MSLTEPFPPACTEAESLCRRLGERAMVEAKRRLDEALGVGKSEGVDHAVAVCLAIIREQRRAGATAGQAAAKAVQIPAETAVRFAAVRSEAGRWLATRVRVGLGGQRVRRVG